ncbi:MAG: right-handed parallel beta-helix repeat-containing protein [Candidatus Eisenbacteria bacterium]|uniref:Right-handed parallel beta-helix repeat-containing protein n=1 Tax=Eiseniibacteriota bacterium TaxID=2212470 RepID=A0A538UDA3_UNCEI|nr:MAG: right-handed parallel beta-helix repeat-containing protein [Candidatus Eisenbacteria bacterium]
MNALRSHVRPEPCLPSRGVGAALAILPLVVFILFLPMRATATVYYVDGSSGACSDATSGSASQPYCTIGAALAQHHAAGTTIQVMAGTYREQITVPASGVAGAPIVVQAAPGATVVLDGTDDYSAPGLWQKLDKRLFLAASVTWVVTSVLEDGRPLAVGTGDPAHMPEGSYQVVAGKGLYVRDGERFPDGHMVLVGHRNYGVYLSGRAWVNVNGFTIVRAQDRGIQLINATHVEVTHNDVSRSGRMGLQLKGCSAVHVADNRLHDNGDHGIAMTGGTNACIIERNESFGNAYAPYREANGIYLYGAPRNVIRQNRLHDNQDTGLHIQARSDSNLCLENRSWHNGDHGYDHMRTNGNIHIGDVAYGNYKDGFSFEGNAFGQTLSDCIATENGLTTNEYDLWVDDSSSVGIQTNDNIFWNSTPQPPVKFRFTRYASVADYAAASGQDTRTLQSDPRFVDPATADFHLRLDSPAIDNANTSLPDWPATDADGHARFDDPLVLNGGMGPVAYADRGAFEFVLPLTTLGLGPPPLRTGDGPGGVKVSSATPATDPAARLAARVWPNLVVQPNPLRGAGSLSFRLAQAGRVTASLFAVDGRRVRNLMDAYLEVGDHTLDVSTQDERGTPLPQGIYFCDLRAPEGRAIQRVMVSP